MNYASMLGAQKLRHLPGPSPWVKFNMVINGSTTDPTMPPNSAIAVNQAYWRQNGENMDLVYMFRTNALGASVGSGNYLFNLPPGFHLDTDILPLTFNGFESIVLGGFSSKGTTGIYYFQPVSFSNATQFFLMTSSGSPIGSGNNGLGSIADTSFSVNISFPCREFRFNG